MPEVATESFCERCGTRYAVQTDGGVGGLRRARAVFSGLTHYVMSTDSLTDAMTDARRVEEDKLNAVELDAFHSTFRFCLNCRQYACRNCWNEDEAQCRTCAPMVGPGAPPDPIAVMNVLTPTDAVTTTPVVAPTFDAWPAQDAGMPAESWPAAELAAAVEPVVEEPEAVEPEPVLAFEAEVEPGAPVEPEPEMVFEAPEPVDIGYEEVNPVTASWLYGEPVEVEVEPEPVYEPVAEVEPDPEYEPMAAFDEPEPVYEPVAEVEPEPEYEPMAAFDEPEPVFDATPTIIPMPEPVEPETPELAARRAKLDLLGLPDPGQGSVADGLRQSLPYRSTGATASPSQSRALAARMAASGMWDASVREVASAGGSVTECSACQLQLSASARFCRRCGTPQTKSA